MEGESPAHADRRSAQPPDPARRRRIDAVFVRALEVPSAERAAFLQRACPQDLRREVVDLLALCEDDSPLLPGSTSADHLLDATVGDDDEPLPIGARVGAYRILRALGSGGMGAVYEAERTDGAFDQRVAIKVLRWEAASPAIRRRFLRERQILAGLKHPNIAPILDGGVTADGRPWFAMDLVDGERIDRFCDHRRLTIEARLRLFAAVAATVQAAHRSLVVHRDLKPTNILVTRAGEVRLLDFGIAKLLHHGPEPQDPEPQDPETQLTRTLERVLTPEYASPEQVRGEPVTTASDVYQLGLLLHELLTGTRAHRLEHGTPAAIERAICEREPSQPSAALRACAELQQICARRSTTPRRLRRTLRGDLDRVVLKALAKEPGRRYGSAEALVLDVERYLAGQPVEARAGNRWYRARKFVRRHRLAVAIASSVAVLLVAATFALSLQNLRIQRERDRARLEAEKSRQVRDFLARLFEEADPYQTGSEPLTAHQLLVAGADRLESSPGVPPEVAAEMMAVVGSILQNRGDYERSERLLRESLRLREERSLEDPSAVAESLRLLAALCNDTDRREESIALIDRALALYQSGARAHELPAEARVGWARALDQLGVIHLRQGDYELAELRFREALERRIALYGVQSLEVAAQLNNLAITVARRGRPAESEALHRRALELRRRLAPADSPALSESLNNLAVLLRHEERYAEAEPLLREALAARRRAFGDHPRTANALHNLANTVLALEQLDEAEELHREALALRRRILGDRHSNVGMSLRDLGRTLSQRGETVEADSLLVRAEAMLAETLGPAHEATSWARFFLSRLWCESGRAGEGLPLLERTLPLLDALPARDSRQTAEVRLVLGRCLLELGERDRARVALLDARRVLLSRASVSDPMTRAVAEQLARLD